MFKLTAGRGFHITFNSGFTVSVQFGGGNYSDNYNAPYQDETKPSKTAEIAVWHDSNKEMLSFGDDTVKGYVSPDKVLEVMNIASSSKSIDECVSRIQEIESYDSPTV